MRAEVSDAQIEALTQQIGREIFERMRADRPGWLRSEWWEQRVLNRLTQDEWLKVQFFRFIDVLPALGDRREIARHLREYFAEAYAADGEEGGEATRSELQVALDELSPPSHRGRGSRLARAVARCTDWTDLDSPAARAVSWAALWAAGLMARRFIAGSDVRQAVHSIERLRRQRLAFTIDVLGEAALSRTEADAYLATYLELIDTLPRHAAAWPTVPLIDQADGRPLPRVNISVKLTSLHPGMDAIDPERAKRVVRERLRPLLQRAVAAGVHVHVDMEHYAIKDLTLEICRELFCEPEVRDYPHLGLVIQAYLRDAERDARELLEWVRARGTPIWVRLVKGAYWDSETVWAAQRHWPCPVWQEKWQSDACFERLTRLLLANHPHVYTALGSHNVRSLAHAMALQRLWEVPARSFEVQMLYGMGDPIKRALVAMGQRCRIYTPYGPWLPGMAYLIRRLLENTSNESFLRHTLTEDVPLEELLRDPREIGRRTPPHRPPPLLRFEFEEPIMDPFENVPGTDFARPENRTRMESALRAQREHLPRECPLIIGSQRVTTGRWQETRNPACPAQVVGRIAQADAPALEQAARAAADALPAWRDTPGVRRAELLNRVARLMDQRRLELAALVLLETGKPWREADADVCEAIDYCEYYAREWRRISQHVRRRDIPGETNEYSYWPRGVTAVISPWNFPLAVPAGLLAAAIVTGNTVVWKPASAAGACGSVLAEVFAEAGLPAGVLNFLPGAGAEIGPALVAHPLVSQIAFTGSRDAGIAVHRTAATTLSARPSLKRAIIEMGGKNAIIIDTDADLDEAVKGVIQSAFACAGQKCTACSRVIALEGVYERFLGRLLEAARSVTIGPAEQPGTFIPPLIDQAAYRRVREYIEIGRQEARCVLEVDPGSAGPSQGWYVGPVIFADVPPAARIAREEIFGPVLCVLRAADIGQAIEIFNGTDYALTGGIYSRSPASIRRARRECECGTFYINRRITGSAVDLQPFGGSKLSGSGARVGGPDYLIQFCEPRTVCENTLRRGFAPEPPALTPPVSTPSSACVPSVTPAEAGVQDPQGLG